MDCGVCCNTYNISNHKKVLCSFCDYSSCRGCIQGYLLSTFQDAHCMNCKSLWNREFLDRVCTKSFMNNAYKNHREKILFEREKILMPSTQPYVSREIRARAMMKQVDELNKKLDDIYRERNEIWENIHILRSGSLEANINEERRKFIRKCPIENCRGFLSTQWRCGVCETHICNKCNESNSMGHQCDPDAVKTMELLKKDTKGCPSCGTMISFISGCRQMWCPSCHTAFDWNTLQIDTGRIHNPHFYEFKMKSGIQSREHGDIPCGGLPDLYELCGALGISRAYLIERNPLTLRCRKMTNLHRSVIHLDRVELVYVYNIEQENNQDLRMKYMLSELSESEFRIKIQRREKSREKKRDIHNILRMFVDTSSDLLRQLVLKRDDIDIIENILEQLVIYTNGELNAISHRYNCVVPWIHDDWEFRK